MPNSPTKIQPSALCSNELTSGPFNDDKAQKELKYSEIDNEVTSPKTDSEFNSSINSSENFTETDSEVESVNHPIKIKSAGLFRKRQKSAKIIESSGSLKISTFFKKLDKPTKSPQHKSDSELSDDFTKEFEKHDFSESPICEALELRQRNILERDAFMASFLNDPEFAEAANNIGIFKKQSENSFSAKSKTKKKRRHTDGNFRFTGHIPMEQRKSLRLQDKEPIFKYDDLVDETDYAHGRRKRKMNDSFDDDYEYTDLEKVVFRPKKSYNRSKATGGTFLKVEDVTDNMIKNIAWKVSEKQYSSAGSSCHQCRQKTLDTKTSCRDKECVGVRGQFCGVCLENRYGENAAEALKNPDWRCPVCRGICNCSFCRSKAGKRPTGILAPIAHRNGHKSVKDFLDSLRGEGDYVDESMDPRNLLGFSKDLDYAHMGGNVIQCLFRRK